MAWNSTTGRVYTLDLHQAWSNVTGYVDLPGTGSVMAYTNAAPEDEKYYAIAVRLAE